MKTIPLTKGQHTLVDDADFERLAEYKWQALKLPNHFYAVRQQEGRSVLMHREILGLTDPNVKVNHRNGNGLDNQKENFQVATQRENLQAFQTPRKGKTSKFRGVSWCSSRKKWATYIQKEGRCVYVGRFVSEVDAARAYDTAARESYGPFACPNFPLDETTQTRHLD